MPTRADNLRSIPLFRGMTDRAVEAIVAVVETASMPARYELAREGEPGESFLVIVAGRASVAIGGRRVRELGAGDYLGEISLIDGGRRTATIIAIEPITALVVTRAAFWRLMNDYPAVRLDVVLALTSRLRERAPSVTD